ncbi:hypothetical protein FRC11_015050 [Ceratobasidium sp. 423]|nr:hypothetical protein FRC11_015050 [Ceratobasidium sp. 423]
MNTLPKDQGKKADPNWPGYGEYRGVVLAMLNRRGGIMARITEIMSRLGFSPADHWKAERDVNRSAPLRYQKDEYKMDIKSTNTSLENEKLQAEVALKLFGRNAVSSRGIILHGYKETVHTLLNWLYERKAKKLRTVQKRSKNERDLVDEHFEEARNSRTAAALFQASKKLVDWRKTALESLEHDEPHFLMREKRLKDLWAELGFQQEGVPGKVTSSSKAKTTSSSKAKTTSIIPTDEEMQLAFQYYIEEYCNGLGAIDDVYASSTPDFMKDLYQLIDEEADIGVNHLKDWTTPMLWESAGVPGATQFPFAEPGTTGAKGTGHASKEAAIPYWHQQVGSHATIEGAYTANIGDRPRPTLLCDDVGLGKTIQIIGVFSMLRHYYEQQGLDESQRLPPPPFTIANNTPYFAGLERIPNLPSLVISPRTLSDQWVEQWAKFTQSGAFSIVRYSVDQGPLEDFCTDPNGAYLKAAGKNQERAGSVIILADLSAVAMEAQRCLEVPDELHKRKDAQLEEAKGEVAEFISTVDTTGSLLRMKFRAVAVDECHNLRNSNHAQRGSQVLTDNACLVIGATATMIFTSIWDALAQARVMRYEPVLGQKGVVLSERIMESIKDRTRHWDSNSLSIIEKTVLQEAKVEAAEAGISTEEPCFKDLQKKVGLKYENEEQVSILRSAYISQGAIKMLRKVLQPIIIRRTRQSVDNSGEPILDLPPVQNFTAWSPMAKYERETQQEINQEHQQRKKAGSKNGKQDLAVIKWHNFLMSQKDAAVHVLIYRLKKLEEEKRKQLKGGAALVQAEKTQVSKLLVKTITAKWDESNINDHASTRMLKVDDIIEHYWVGNPPPIVFNEDGTRDLATVVQNPWPCDKPRKFLIYVAYHTHRDLMAVMFKIKKRGYVCYDGSMVTSKRRSAISQFNNNPDCRIMVISNVGSAGLNLVAASVVIVVSNVWSGLEKNQIFGRVVRPGQKRDVVLYNIVAPEGIDLALMCYSESKTALSNQFLMSRKEEGDDDAETEQRVDSSVVKPSKVVARKRKDRDEDGLGDTLGVGSGSPVKRAKLSSNKKDAPVKGRREATKAQPTAGASRSKKGGASTAQSSGLQHSNQAKDAPPTNDKGKAHQAQLPKSQEAPTSPGAGAMPSTTPRPKPKVKPMPATLLGSGSNKSSSSQKMPRPDSLCPPENQGSVSLVASAPPSKGIQDSAPKRLAIPKPPPKRAVIPISPTQSPAHPGQHTSNTSGVESSSLANQKQGVLSGVGGGQQAGRPVVPTISGSGSSQPSKHVPPHGNVPAAPIPVKPSPSICHAQSPGAGSSKDMGSKPPYRADGVPLQKCATLNQPPPRPQPSLIIKSKCGVKQQLSHSSAHPRPAATPSMAQPSSVAQSIGTPPVQNVERVAEHAHSSSLGGPQLPQVPERPNGSKRTPTTTSAVGLPSQKRVKLSEPPPRPAPSLIIKSKCGVKQQPVQSSAQPQRTATPSMAQPLSVARSIGTPLVQNVERVAERAHSSSLGGPQLPQVPERPHGSKSTPTTTSADGLPSQKRVKLSEPSPRPAPSLIIKSKCGVKQQPVQSSVQPQRTATHGAAQPSSVTRSIGAPLVQNVESATSASHADVVKPTLKEQATSVQWSATKSQQGVSTGQPHGRTNHSSKGLSVMAPTKEAPAVKKAQPAPNRPGPIASTGSRPTTAPEPPLDRNSVPADAAARAIKPLPMRPPASRKPVAQVHRTEQSTQQPGKRPTQERPASVHTKPPQNQTRFKPPPSRAEAGQGSTTSHPPSGVQGSEVSWLSGLGEARQKVVRLPSSVSSRDGKTLNWGL